MASRQKKLERFRLQAELYAEEIAEMVKHCRQAYVTTEGWEEFVTREFRAAWDILRKDAQIDTYVDQYPYQLWRDAVARKMGWLHGRIGSGDKEFVRQRRLEAAGQIRMFG